MCTIELNRQRINKKDDIYQNSWLDILVTKMCSRRKLNQFILIKKLFNFLTLFTFHLLTYCKKFPCNAYHINSWFCGNFLKKAVHTESFDGFLSGLEWIFNLEFCLLKLLIFYQKLSWNIRSRLNTSTFWVFEPVFRYVWSKLKLFAQKMKILIKYI